MVIFHLAKIQTNRKHTSFQPLLEIQNPSLYADSESRTDTNRISDQMAYKILLDIFYTGQNPTRSAEDGKFSDPTYMTQRNPTRGWIRPVSNSVLYMYGHFSLTTVHKCFTNTQAVVICKIINKVCDQKLFIRTTIRDQYTKIKIKYYSTG